MIKWFLRRTEDSTSASTQKQMPPVSPSGSTDSLPGLKAMAEASDMNNSEVIRKRPVQRAFDSSSPRSRASLAAPLSTSSLQAQFEKQAQEERSEVLKKKTSLESIPPRESRKPKRHAYNEEEEEEEIRYEHYF